MPEAVWRQLRRFGVDQIDRVLGLGPRGDEVFARVDGSHAVATLRVACGVVNDGIAILGEAHTDHQMTARRGWLLAAQHVPRDRAGEGYARRDPVLQLRNV